jgi:putative oxidoreductase
MSKNLAGRVALATGGPRGDGAAPAEYHAPQNGQGRQVTGATNRATAEDYGKLLLRLAVGGLMLFHGLHKVRHGVGWMLPLLEAKGLPALMAYGSYLGEVAAPLLILAGVLTRLSSLTVAGTMVMAVYLALAGQVFALTEHGGWAIELNAFFFLGASALALLGPGKLSAWRVRPWWLQ